MFKNFWILIFLNCCNLVVAAQSGSLKQVKFDVSNFEAINRSISINTTDGKNVVHLDAADGAGVAWLKQINFATGTIEFDVKGKDTLQQSFVGIAFHGSNDSTYDCIYFRPFNFNATDTVRKSHAVQYISMPQYDWQYLREKFPLQYEHQLISSIDANSWFRAKIVVEASTIKVFLNNNDKLSLAVIPLNNYSTGKIGFWVGNGSEGDFANLTISKQGY